MKTIQEQKPVERFEVKQEVKVITALSKILDKIDVPISEEEAIKKEYLAEIDVANVCLIEGLTEKAKRCLSRFIDKDAEERKIPGLQYNTKEGNGQIESKYNIDYFKSIIDLLKATNEDSFLIKLNTDYPATLENKHFRIILAPRIGED